MNDNLINERELFGNDCRIIPMNMCPTKKYSITFEGWEEFVVFYASDENLNTLMSVCHSTLKKIVEAKKGKYAFSHPEFVIRPNEGLFIVTIGTMEIEDLDRRMDNREKDE